VTLRDDKRALRERLVARRDAIDVEQRAAASQAIASRIVALAGYDRARVVLLTLPFRSEWNALLLARHALSAGKTVVAPRVDPAARMLRLLRIVDLDRDVEPGYRGIPEPRATCEAVSLQAIDWILTPGVAFDASGRRLGYGGGYYDRLLPLLPRTAPRVAGAFEVQVAERVPAAPHDIAVDCIVTEQRVIECARMPA
jgi:5-formyltetrahydrofolate cyclo-ligase